MFNILLDTLPTDYNGWLIRTDFRIGVQISLAMADKELSDSDKTAVALHLLYGNGIPDMATAVDGLRWFMRGGADERTDLPTDNEPPSFFWDFDSGRIWASFKATYGIDLHTANMHWFEFCDLMASVSNDTALGKAMEVRNFSVKGIKGEERAKVVKAKMALTPPKQKTEDEKEEENALKGEMEDLMRTVKHG